MNNLKEEIKSNENINTVTPEKSEKTRATHSFLFCKARIFSSVAVLFVFCVIGLLFFIRPKVSESEKRELSKFPTPTFESFISGKFTSDVSLWYSDTFPFRDGLIRGDSFVKSFYGLRGEQLSAVRGDDIPVDVNIDLDKFIKDLDHGDNNGKVTEDEGETIDGYYVNGNTAYQLYAFNEANSLQYSYLMNKAAEKLNKNTKFYNIIAPLSYSFSFDGNKQKALGMTDAEKAINFMYSYTKDGVNDVDLFPILEARKDEYIYFRTDHHWTALGAYYAYCAYCQSAGITPTPLSSLEKRSFNGFLGTLYEKTRQNPKLKADTVHAYIPNGTNSATVYEKGKDEPTTYQVVNTTTDKWYQSASSKYNCFIAGDNPFTIIHNEQKNDGSAVLLVKDSFGNSFAPFLVDSYEYVYVIDYRYYKETLSYFLSKYSVDSVIFINNIINTSVGIRINELKEFIG